MKHYDFASQFSNIYRQAVARFGSGHRGADAIVSADEAVFLRANGITAQHLYDYAEDHMSYNGEPGYDLAQPTFSQEELDEMDANLDRTADMIEAGMKKKP